MAKTPKLVIFDLDYTLWPFWVDTHVNPPFAKNSNGTIIDSRGKTISCYPEVPEVLENLHNEGYQLAVASRTHETEGANQLIELFGWEKYFSYKEIFPGCKVEHIDNIRKQSKVLLNEMIFFDDEPRNISDLVKHGVVSILVKSGVSKEVIKDGLEEYAHKKPKHGV